MGPDRSKVYVYLNFPLTLVYVVYSLTVTCGSYLKRVKQLYKVRESRLLRRRKVGKGKLRGRGERRFISKISVSLSRKKRNIETKPNQTKNSKTEWTVNWTLFRPRREKSDCDEPNRRFK